MTDCTTRAAGTVLAAAILASLGATGPAGIPTPTDPPGQPPAEPVEIVLLGTSHFAGSALDEHSSEVSDVLSEQRQTELGRIADRFADFGPQRVFLECDRSSQPAFDSLYATYASGAHDPTAEGIRNERQQLGFRIAERAGADGVTCVDAFGLWLADQAERVAAEHNPDWLDSLRSYERRSDAAYLADHTIGEYLRWLNTDSLLYENYQVYNRFFVRFGSFEGEDRKLRWEGDLDGEEYAFAGDFGGFPMDWVRQILRSVNATVADSVSAETDVVVRGSGLDDAALAEARAAGAEVIDLGALRDRIAEEAELYVGFPDAYVGADLVAEWYKRNVRIYANLLHRLEPDDRRAVVLIGQAHVWPLREMLRANPRFEVVPVDDVL